MRRSILDTSAISHSQYDMNYACLCLVCRLKFIARIFQRDMLFCRCFAIANTEKTDCSVCRAFQNFSAYTQHHRSADCTANHIGLTGANVCKPCRHIVFNAWLLEKHSRKVHNSISNSIYTAWKSMKIIFLTAHSHGRRSPVSEALNYEARNHLRLDMTINFLSRIFLLRWNVEKHC